jgi:hypothetical protein
MNKVNVMIVFLSICALSMTKAQSESFQLLKQSKAANILDSVVIYEIQYNVKKGATELSKLLKNEVKKEFVKFLVDTSSYSLTISIDTFKVNLLEIKKVLSNKGFMLLAVEEKNAKEEIIISKLVTPIEKYNTEIDRFLNIEDTTIFLSNFKKINLMEIHPSRRNYYQIIEIISDIIEKINKIENRLSMSKINEDAKRLDMLPEKLKTIHLEQAKIDIVNVQSVFKKLSPFGHEFNYLSSQQKDFYRSLKNKFNDLYDRINPE